MRHILFILIFVQTACVAAHSQCPARFTQLRVPGALIAQGTVVDIHTAKGDIKIEAVGAQKRKYSWDGGNHTVPLGEMFYSKDSEPIGLYNAQWYPHPFGFVGNVSKMQGIVHGLSSEAIVNFPNEKEALDWLFVEPGAIPYVWRKDGLCAWYSKQENVVSVDLFQIYINGSKPSNFPGGTTDSITLCGHEIPQTTNAHLSKKNCAEEFRRYLEQDLSIINPTASDLVNTAHCQVVVGKCDAALATLARAEQLDRKVDNLEGVRAKAIHRKLIEQERGFK